MKRILFFALLVSCMSFTQAQILTVSYNNAEVADGDTLSLIAPANNEIQFRPIFNNNEFFNIVCRIQGEKLNNTTSEITSICTVVCKDGYLSAPFPFPGNSTYDETVIDFDVPADAEMGLFKITIYDTANTDTRAYFFVKVYNKNAAGIADVHNNVYVAAYPNPTYGQARIDYISNDGNGKLVVYNLSGVCVREMSLNAGQGSVSIDLSGLPSGVYVYGIKNDQNGTTMKKLVVK